MVGDWRSEGWKNTICPKCKVKEKYPDCKLDKDGDCYKALRRDEW